MPTARYVAPQLRAGALLASDGQNWSTSVYGTAPDYFAIRDWQPAVGSLFEDADVARARRE